MKTYHKAWFRARALLGKFLGEFRRLYFRVQGMDVSCALPSCSVTWPHRVKIGRGCVIESGVSFKYDGIWGKGKSINIGNDVFIGSNVEFNVRKSVVVGRGALIAAGCRFIDHDHGVSRERPIRFQLGSERAIVIEEDVWLGANVLVLKGVRIGRGAVVAAGAVVTREVAPYEIWAGVPARKIGERSPGPEAIGSR